MNIFNKELDDFIFPIFVYENQSAYNKSLELKFLNQSKVHLENLIDRIELFSQLRISNLLLFGIPNKRNLLGTESSNKRGVIQRAIKTIKENFGNKLNLMSDVCLCQYNTSGQCGISYKTKMNHKKTIQNSDSDIDNDKTLKALGKISLSLCESGTDFIAPSSMMDGQVSYLRHLIKKNGFSNVRIMSYSAKHNSCLYTPFRTNNYLHSGYIDKASYQSSFYNAHESVREILFDVKEGSDWVMIKPSLWYFDIIKLIKEYISIPLVVQNVSGEYALIKAGVENESIDQYEWVEQFLRSLKRAGADKIITYLLIDLLINKVPL